MHVITHNGNHMEAFTMLWDAQTFLGFNEYRAADGWRIVYVEAEPVYWR